MSSSAIPRHIAIVMDGNGRWAERRGYPRVFGHVRGARRVWETVEEASRLGAQALTLFAFSSENWERPKGEVATLWRLLKKHIVKSADDMARMNVRFQVIGELERLASDLRDSLSRVTERLSRNTGLVLTVAISYGSRRELTAAAKKFADDCLSGSVTPADLTDESFNKYLWTASLGKLSDVDLLIRTSGEQRTSNFLLWQAAYAEYYFTSTLWPDFRAGDLRLAVESFQRRDRRFGRLNACVDAGPQAGAGK